MTRFWWVRHGPTHAKTMVGWSDLPADLSDTERLERLSHYLPADALLVSSDLSRTRATADAIGGDRRRLPDDPNLREFNFGNWELKHFTEIDQETPELSRAYWENPGDVRPPNGESWNEAAARVSRGTDTLIEAHAGRDIIVVAHFGAILTQLQRALDISAEEVLAQRIDNLSVTELSYDGTWHVGQINHCP